MIRLLRCQGGATAIEYALLASLIGAAIILGVSLLGDNLGNSMNETATIIGG